MKDSIRAGYKQLGVEGYYKKYSNPHLEEIECLMSKLLESYDIGNHILDMCCGSGEITKIILKHKGTEKTKTAKIKIEGLDPFTYKTYQKNTNKSWENKNVNNEFEL